MIQTLPNYFAMQLAEMDTFLMEELKKLVSWGWTYAVIWRIGPDHRTPVWHQSYFSESLAGSVAGTAQRFESIYRQCQFTPVRPGYAYMAWMRQSPFWWTRLMEPIPTDESKESFLAELGIQTLVCFPGRSIPHGTAYCVELACTALISETEVLRTSIQEFLNTSIDPYISTPSSLLSPGAPGTLDMDIGVSPTTSSAMAALAHQTTAILTDITSQASMVEEEVLEGFGNILRQQEPYIAWTMSSGSHYVTAGLPQLQSFDGVENYASLQDLGFAYEPFEGMSVPSQAPGASEWASSRKGKEILVEEGDLVPGTGKALHPSPNLNLMQEEFLEKLRSPPAGVPASQKTLLPGMDMSAEYRSGRPVGGMPSGHIPSSKFRLYNRHLRSPRGTMKKKREPLIYKWATSAALRFRRSREEMLGFGGSSFDGLSPGTEGMDPRSPNSVAHDQQAAVAHKLAERNRRSKFRLKLETLISIIPLVNKKKDKVSVLSSTIDYIRQLNLRISSLKKLEEESAAPSTSRREDEAGAAVPIDREEEPLSMSNEADRPSSSSPLGGAPVVAVEGAPGDDTWVIKVEANNRSRSLIQLLNVLLELELGVVTVDYGTRNGRFHATICVKNSKSSSTTSGELQATLCRVLEARDSPVTGSD